MSMPTRTKALPLYPPATEAELERASQIWTAAQDVMVARGFGRTLWGNQHASGHEFVVLILREATAGYEAQVAAYKKTSGELADKLRERGTSDNLVTGANR